MSTTSTTALPGSVPQTTPQEEFPSLLNKDIEWSSSMSPYHYELVRFPSGVSKCYGCGEVFAEKYHSPPHDLIVRHKTGESEEKMIAQDVLCITTSLLRLTTIYKALM